MGDSLVVFRFLLLAALVDVFVAAGLGFLFALGVFYS
jgi:hypothetical protein